MAEREPIDTGIDKRYVRRDKRGRFKGSDDAGRSPSADRRLTATAPEIHGVHPPVESAALLEGIPELVAATREQTAAIERQTAVIERLLTFLSPAAAAAHDRQKAARAIATADAVRQIG